MPRILNLVCPSCDAVCRLPAYRAGAGSRCDRCREPMFLGHSIPLDDAARFRKHIVSNDVPVLVAFSAPWCGPCRVTAPEFEKAARRLEPHFRLGRVNTDSERDLSERYGIQAIPTMILFSHGREVARRSGSIRAVDIARFAAEHDPAHAAPAAAE